MYLTRSFKVASLRLLLTTQAQKRLNPRSKIGKYHRFHEILLLDIYPAREIPIEGITSKWLLSKIVNNKKKVCSKDNLVASILESDAKIILTIGAGDIGELVPIIKSKLIEVKS